MMASGRILVVDDEASARYTLTEILRLEGYEVDDAPNGKLALQRLAQKDYDVVLLDIIMPELSGLEVLAQLDNVAPDVEVILLTAHSSVDSAIAALRHGAADYLLKPANPKEILQAVGKALKRRRQRERQRMLLQQLEQSVQQLKSWDNEGEAATQPLENSIALPNGAWVDLTRRRLYYAGEEISLSPAEARLLGALLEHRGEVLSHRDLVRMVQGYEVTAWEAPEMLRPLVSRLRAKLDHVPGGRDWIVNIRGVGYVLELPEDKPLT